MQTIKALFNKGMFFRRHSTFRNAKHCLLKAVSGELLNCTAVTSKLTIRRSLNKRSSKHSCGRPKVRQMSAFSRFDHRFSARREASGMVLLVQLPHHDHGYTKWLSYTFQYRQKTLLSLPMEPWEERRGITQWMQPHFFLFCSGVYVDGDKNRTHAFDTPTKTAPL